MFTNASFLAVLAVFSYAGTTNVPSGAEPPKWSMVQRVPDQSRERPVNVLTINERGGLHWNGANVTEAQVRQFVAVTEPMKKAGNIMVLEAHADAPSAVVERLRQMIDNILACQPAYCSEVVPEPRAH